MVRYVRWIVVLRGLYHLKYHHIWIDATQTWLTGDHSD